MSYVLAFLGFAALIILHEAGHFVAAKAVGMRVERFSLFFGPLLVKFRRGETEYGIGPIPLGGYVKITGMNPNEDIPEEARPRAYYNQPVWKRVVVILAGPAVNLLIAFAIIWGCCSPTGQRGRRSTGWPAVAAPAPAATVLRAGDQLVSVDGVGGSPTAIRNQIDSHRCAGAPVSGLPGGHARPDRAPARRKADDASTSAPTTAPRQADGARLPVRRRGAHYPGAVSAARTRPRRLWSVTTQTVSTVARIFEPQERKQLPASSAATRSPSSPSPRAPHWRSRCWR